LYTGGYYGPGGYADTSAPDGVSTELYFFDSWPQNLTLPYGKVLRIDVDSTTGNLSYGIPKSNPWANNTKNYDPKIYAWGFRNPFRLSFDRKYYQDGIAVPSNGYFPFWISASSETLFDATELVDSPGNFGWAVKQGSHCFSRRNPLVPPDVVNCTVHADCVNVTVHGQNPMCGSNGRCTCNMVDAEGYIMKNPAIEYVNDNAAEQPVAKALVTAGLLANPLGRASLGGYIYRGSAIPWLFEKFVNGDFAVDQLDGQLLIVTDPGDGSTPWPIERGYVFDKASLTKAGFLKTIGEDADGELYAITGEFDAFNQIDGRVFKIIAAKTAGVANDTLTYPPFASPPPPGTSPTESNTSAASNRLVISLGLGVAIVLAYFAL
jgi:hypothetical protein